MATFVANYASFRYLDVEFPTTRENYEEFAKLAEDPLPILARGHKRERCLLCPVTVTKLPHHIVSMHHQKNEAIDKDQVTAKIAMLIGSSSDDDSNAGGSAVVTEPARAG